MRGKKEIVERFLETLGRPETEAVKIMAFADFEFDEALDTLLFNVLEEEAGLSIDSAILKEILDKVESNPELAESIMVYQAGGVFPKENAAQIKLFNLLNAFDLECVSTLVYRMTCFVKSRMPNLECTELSRADGTQSLYNVILAEKFDLADYLLSLDPDYKKTMHELVNKHGLVKTMFETFNLPVFRWQLTKKPDLRWGIDLGVSYIQRLEYSKSQLIKNYSGVDLQKKLEDANEFRNLIFEGLGYDLKAVNYDQLKCLNCPPWVKEKISYLAELAKYNIISTVECIKGRSKYILALINDYGLGDVLNYFSNPQLEKIVPKPTHQFTLFRPKYYNYVQTFIEQIPIFDRLEKLRFAREIFEMAADMEISGQMVIEILQNRSTNPCFHKDIGKAEFKTQLDGWIKIIMTHLQNGEGCTLEYLFFNSIMTNNIETVKIAVIAMEKAGWHLDKTDRKLLQSLEIHKNSFGEKESWNMFLALRPAFNKEEVELTESLRLA